jgi:thymidylate synthase
MIRVTANNSWGLFTKAFMEMYRLPNLGSDPRNYRDTSAILSIPETVGQEPVFLDESGFHSNFNYDEYIEGGNEWMKIEIEHYNKEYVESKKIDALVKLFENDMYTRRGVISLWNNPMLDLEQEFPCTVYAWFRNKEGVLNMNYHMRANDAYKILLMDIQIATALHTFVCYKLGLQKGTYNHIVDTLHFYREHTTQIDSLYKKITANEK